MNGRSICVSRTPPQIADLLRRSISHVCNTLDVQQLPCLAQILAMHKNSAVAEHVVRAALLVL